jgi:hypothetical protein
MKNILRQSDGLYHVGNKTYSQLEGSRASVKHGNAYKTSGGLTDADLVYSSKGRIVSKKKSSDSKKNNNLKKHGWTFKKGSFGPVKMDKKSRKQSRKSKKSCK